MDHPQSSVAAIRRSFERFGQREALVVRRSGMVTEAGNGRLMAARELGWTHLAAVIVDDDEATAAAYSVAANQTARVARWNRDVLARRLALLDERDATATGFSLDEIAAYKDRLRQIAERPVGADSRPPAREVRLGDLWALGRHRLLCGDSTAKESYEVVLDGLAAPSAVLTDPPYGIEKDGVLNDAPEILERLLGAVAEAVPGDDQVWCVFQSPGAVATWLDVSRRAGHAVERLLWLYRRAAVKSYRWRGWVMVSDAIILTARGNPDWPKVAAFPSRYLHEAGARAWIGDGLASDRQAARRLRG
ncbi:MAG: ParB/RepB/Spo0J family partition protein, partial [Acidobacteriota bacterium]|nr:ParB/RepB/Spo0J family partition protein [Acidobacteriota bacterium]